MNIAKQWDLSPICKDNYSLYGSWKKAGGGGPLWGAC
jgi:hypothetical protein